VVQLGKAAGFSVEAVPYRSNPATLQALMGGQVPAIAVLLASVIGQHRAGRVRVLAYSGKKRHPAIPEVPTYAEAGYPELTGESWSAMFAPAGTPSHVVERLHQAIAVAVGQPKFKQMLPVDTEPYSVSPAELRQLAIADRDHWRKFFSDPEMLMKAKAG
jgi:tripartite-type tricarboxylate transporter receptor subunit TctC